VIEWDCFASATLRFMSGMETREVLDRSWQDCFAACRWKTFSDATKEGLSTIYLILSLREWLRNSSAPISPSELVFLFRSLHATVPGDMIYGVSGFFGSNSSLGPAAYPIDYNLSASEVYKTFVLWCIQHERNFDVLAQQRYEDGRQRSRFSLPSWATDWKSQAFGQFNLTETSSLPSRLSQVSLAESPNHPICRRRGNTLIARGYIIDIFKEARALTIYKSDSARNKADFQRWLEMIPNDDKKGNLVLFGQEQPTVETLEHLYLQTSEGDSFLPHLWRDGGSLIEPRSTDFRQPLLTKRGCCLAFTFSRISVQIHNADSLSLDYWRPESLRLAAKLDSILGAGKTYCRIICGDCFIDAFGDAKGLGMSQRLRLEV